MRLKMKSPRSISMVILALFISNIVFAEDHTDITVIGSRSQYISPSSWNVKQPPSQHDIKVIQLLEVKLSDEAKHLLHKRAKDITEPTAPYPPLLSSAELPQKHLLGMNNVPVLDQGQHGTCVTFAVTGALDAIIAKGNYISQLCNLQLGNYLEQHGYSQSGWNGSDCISVINQMEQYGIVSMEKQTTKGCGGLIQYPTDSQEYPESFIDPEEYYSMSEFIFGNLVHWSNIYWRISSSWTLSEVKHAINSGDRSVITFLIPRTDLGLVGAVGNYKAKNDTWVLTPEILNQLNSANTGHGIVVTGYDDNAIALDSHGVQHKGLIFLRNSWGSKYGDSGDFYMSYDYFKLLTFGVNRFGANQPMTK
jgi:C1A family cysteine protease